MRDLGTMPVLAVFIVVTSTSCQRGHPFIAVLLEIADFCFLLSSFTFLPHLRLDLHVLSFLE